MAWLHTGNSCPQCRKIINPELEVVRRATRERRDAHTGNNNNARENNDNDDETESLWSSTVSTITTAGPTTWIFIVLIAFIVRSRVTHTHPSSSLEDPLPSIEAEKLTHAY